jgi:hypothetical protein
MKKKAPVKYIYVRYQNHEFQADFLTLLIFFMKL